MSELIPTEEFKKQLDRDFKKLRGRCGRKQNLCAKCGNEYTLKQLEGRHYCDCGFFLYCTNTPGNQDLGDVGFDYKTRQCGGPCRRCMTNKQYEDYRKRLKKSPVPMLHGELGELQEMMIGDKSYGSIKGNATLMDARLHELVNRLNKSEPASQTWLDLQDSWENFSESMKAASALKKQINPNPANKTEERRNESVMKAIKAHESITSQSLKEIGELISGGADYEKLWSEVESINSTVASLKQQEGQRLQNIGAMVGPEQVYEILTVLQASVVEVVERQIDKLSHSKSFTKNVDIDDVKNEFFIALSESVNTGKNIDVF